MRSSISFSASLFSLSLSIENVASLSILYSSAQIKLFACGKFDWINVVNVYRTVYVQDGEPEESERRMKKTQLFGFSLSQKSALTFASFLIISLHSSSVLCMVYQWNSDDKVRFNMRWFGTHYLNHTRTHIQTLSSHLSGHKTYAFAWNATYLTIITINWRSNLGIIE